MCPFLTEFTKDIGRFSKLLLLTSAFLLLVSCESSEKSISEPSHDHLEPSLKEFVVVFPVLNDYQWKIHSSLESEDRGEIEIELDGKSGDTTIMAALWKTTSTGYTNKDVCYSISRFIKTYSDGEFTHEIHYSAGSNMLFHYYYPGFSDNPRNRIFIKGKYRYLYNLGVLDSLQVEYYLQNQDSLDKVKGNALPGLPRKK